MRRNVLLLISKWINFINIKQDAIHQGIPYTGLVERAPKRYCPTESGQTKTTIPSLTKNPLNLQSQ